MAKRDKYAPGEFCWVDLASHDMKSAAKFYGSVFGWGVQEEDTAGGPPYATFVEGELGLAGLGEMTDAMKAMGIPPPWNSYVNVEDLDASLVKAQELGATVIVPATDVMDVGRLAFILDPAGTSLAMWQAKSYAGSEKVNEPNCFCWNELATKDLEASQKFYGELFGWSFRKHDQSPSPYLIIENAGRDNGGFLLMTEEWGEHPPYWGVYFAVSDVPATVENCTSAGGKCLHGPFDTPVGPMAVLQDPQGAIFSIIKAGEGC
jgi:predicted enzyme related to lactoylglutathione lyase